MVGTGTSYRVHGEVPSTRKSGNVLILERGARRANHGFMLLMIALRVSCPFSLSVLRELIARPVFGS